MGINFNQSYDDIVKRILEVNPNYRVWEFGEPSNFGPDFQSGDFVISIIDEFGGKVPRLISKETIKWNAPLPLIPTITLDSNVMSVLNDFVLHPERLSVDKTKVIIKLLDYFIHTKVDYNPGFYSLEAFSKNKESDISKRFAEFSKSILSLHMMDELHFLKRREVKPDKERFEKYSEKFGVGDIDGMARRDYEVTRQMMSSYDDNLNVFYVTLLKMALIHKTSNKDIVSKMRILFEFTFSNFGVLFGEEMGIAAHYFAGKLERLIPLQKGARYDGTISKLRSTTWDVYLLRFPPLMLSQSKPPIPFTKICTGEKELAYIGRKFFIWKLFTSGDEFYPALRIDYSDLYKQYPETTMGKLLQLHKEFEKTRSNRKADQLIKADDVKIEELKLSLEEEIKNFCG
jgi:hypothetical protein